MGSQALKERKKGEKTNGREGATMKRRRTFALTAAALGPILWGVLHWGLGVHVNVSPSMPYGIYVLEGGPAARGDLIRSCLPEEPSALALARGYVAGGPCPYGTAHLLKRIAGVGGDSVSVTTSGTYVNGRLLPRSAPLARDRAGRVMPAAWGHHALLQGSVWLYSDHSERSFDSRYYGPIPDTLLRGRMRPAWTWE